MGQVSPRETAMFAEAAAAREGRTGTVQCEGCPAGTRVIPARPGHLDSCTECSQHCICFKDTRNGGPS